jgi:hypothetical protein
MGKTYRPYLPEQDLLLLLEKIYRCVNIALVNELKQLCQRMGIDIFEVIDAAKTKPCGFQAFYPGPGLGGHCIPIDPFYLSWKAKQFDFRTRFIELAGELIPVQRLPSDLFKQLHLASPVHRPPRQPRRQGRPIQSCRVGQIRCAKWASSE